MTTSIGGTTGITFNDASVQNTAATGFGFKNRLINGSMTIDQRNAGASITADNTTFGVDRFQILASVAGKFNSQQNAGAITPPVGFSNYLGYTSTSAYSVGASEIFAVAQKIEGFNTADLNWGTADAKTITISFWVRSSLTGTFSGFLQNSASNRSFIFSYSIPTANTWTFVTTTVTGDTAGTWIGATNGIGIRLYFTLAAGSSITTSAGSWVASDKYGVTGTTSVVGTNGATFYITGVQLEKGSTATSFDVRDYGTELMLCQRYYEKISVAGSASVSTGQVTGVTSALFPLLLKVTKRDTPTFSTTGSFITLTAAGSSGGGTIALQSATVDSARVDMSSCTGLVSGNATSLFAGSAASLNFSAEL